MRLPRGKASCPEAYTADAAREDYAAFREQARFWLDDFALFTVLLEDQGWRPWYEWPAELARRDPAALVAARQRLDREVRFQQFLQYAFWVQWSRLRAYANEHDVRLVGDIPIFVALDSADVWARPEQ